MIAALRVDELDVDPNPVCRALDASLEHIAYVQFASDLFQVDRLALIAEGSVSPDYRHSADLGKIGGQALSDAVDEVVVLWVARQIREGRTTIERCAGPGLSASDRIEGADRPVSILTS